MAKLLETIRRELNEGAKRSSMFINQPNLHHVLGFVDSGKMHHGHIKDCKRCQQLGDKGDEHAQEWHRLGGANVTKEDVDRNEVDAELDAIYDGQLLSEADQPDHHAIHDLILHADNTAHLYHQSHEPIMHNLAKHAARGNYDPEKARKLWGYHADRAAKDYHKEHGEGHGKWHHMFSPATRRAAAHHWEEHNREEVHNRAKEINAKKAAKGKKHTVESVDQIDEASQHSLMTRPDLHASREHLKQAVHHSQEHQRKFGEALKKYGDHGSLISGAGRDHFPDHVKDELRHHARMTTHHGDEAEKARPKGVHNTTMRALSRAVARVHGYGYYGPHP